MWGIKHTGPFYAVVAAVAAGFRNVSRSALGEHLQEEYPHECDQKTADESGIRSLALLKEKKNRAFVLGPFGLQLLIHRILSVKLDAAENPPLLALIVTTYAPLGVPGAV